MILFLEPDNFVFFSQFFSQIDDIHDIDDIVRVALMACIERIALNKSKWNKILEFGWAALVHTSTVPLHDFLKERAGAHKLC